MGENRISWNSSWEKASFLQAPIKQTLKPELPKLSIDEYRSIELLPDKQKAKGIAWGQFQVQASLMYYGLNKILSPTQGMARTSFH